MSRTRNSSTTVSRRGRHESPNVIKLSNKRELARKPEHLARDILDELNESTKRIIAHPCRVHPLDAFQIFIQI